MKAVVKVGNNLVNTKVPLFLFFLFFFLSFPLMANTQSSAETLFKKKCSLCHGINTQKLGPAISSMPNDAGMLRNIILNGKAAMPAYSGKLTDTQISGLIKYILENQ